MSEGPTQAGGARVVDGRPVPPPGTWTVDPAHSSFEFVARHLMAKVRGRFATFTGIPSYSPTPTSIA